MELFKHRCKQWEIWEWLQNRFIVLHYSLDTFYLHLIVFFDVSIQMSYLAILGIILLKYIYQLVGMGLALIPLKWTSLLFVSLIECMRNFMILGLKWMGHRCSIVFRTSKSHSIKLQFFNNIRSEIGIAALNKTKVVLYSTLDSVNHQTFQYSVFSDLRQQTLKVKSCRMKKGRVDWLKLESIRFLFQKRKWMTCIWMQTFSCGGKLTRWIFKK